MRVWLLIIFLSFSTIGFSQGTSFRAKTKLFLETVLDKNSRMNSRRAGEELAKSILRKFPEHPYQGFLIGLEQLHHYYQENQVLIDLDSHLIDEFFHSFVEYVQPIHLKVPNEIHGARMFYKSFLEQFAPLYYNLRIDPFTNRWLVALSIYLQAAVPEAMVNSLKMVAAKAPQSVPEWQIFAYESLAKFLKKTNLIGQRQQLEELFIEHLDLALNALRKEETLEVVNTWGPSLTLGLQKVLEFPVNDVLSNGSADRILKEHLTKSPYFSSLAPHWFHWKITGIVATQNTLYHSLISFFSDISEKLDRMKATVPMEVQSLQYNIKAAAKGASRSPVALSSEAKDWLRKHFGAEIFKFNIEFQWEMTTLAYREVKALKETFIDLFKVPLVIKSFDEELASEVIKLTRNTVMETFYFYLTAFPPGERYWIKNELADSMLEHYDEIIGDRAKQQDFLNHIKSYKHLDFWNFYSQLANSARADENAAGLEFFQQIMSSFEKRQFCAAQFDLPVN